VISIFLLWGKKLIFYIAEVAVFGRFKAPAKYLSQLRIFT
jgi:hypothetical protein